MASTRRKAAAVAIAIVGVAGLSLAAAAQLNVTSDTLGAGTATVGSCDTNGVNVQYTVTGVNVAAIRITGVADNCQDDNYSVTLNNGATVLTTVSGTDLTFVPAGVSDNQTVVLPVTDTVAASSVTGVAVVFN
jgi:hypothetical protein